MKAAVDPQAASPAPPDAIGRRWDLALAAPGVAPAPPRVASSIERADDREPAVAGEWWSERKLGCRHEAVRAGRPMMAQPGPTRTQRYDELLVAIGRSRSFRALMRETVAAMGPAADDNAICAKFLLLLAARATPRFIDRVTREIAAFDAAAAQMVRHILEARRAGSLLQ